MDTSDSALNKIDFTAEEREQVFQIFGVGATDAIDGVQIFEDPSQYSHGFSSNQSSMSSLGIEHSVQIYDSANFLSLLIYSALVCRQIGLYV